MTFNDDDFPTDYAERIEKVCREAADALRGCCGDRLARLRICAAYFNRGKEEGISHGELIDFLGISAHSVLDRAGYSASEALRVMEDVALISEDGTGVLHPPSTLPSPMVYPSEDQ